MDGPLILYRHAFPHPTPDGEVTIKPNDDTSVIVVGAESKAAAITAIVKASEALEELRRFIESRED